MKMIYKLRFVPLALGVVTLLLGLAVQMWLPTAERNSTLTGGIVLTVVGIVCPLCLRGVKQRELLEAAPTEPDEWSEREMRLRNEIPFLIVRTLFSLLLGLMGLSMVVTGGTLQPGVWVLLLGAALCLLHVWWVVKSARERKRIAAQRQNKN